MLERLNSLLSSKAYSTKSGVKCFVRTQWYRETPSGVVLSAPAFWAQAFLQARVFIITTCISEEKESIYPNGIMSAAILFLHCTAPTKTPTGTKNSTAIYFKIIPLPAEVVSAKGQEGLKVALKPNHIRDLM